MTEDSIKKRRQRGVLPVDLPAMGGWRLFRLRHLYQRGHGMSSVMHWLGIALSILATFILGPLLWHTFFSA